LSQESESDTFVESLEPVCRELRHGSEKMRIVCRRAIGKKIARIPALLFMFLALWKPFPGIPLLKVFASYT